MIDINNYYDDKGTYIFRKEEYVQKQIDSEYKNAEEAKEALINGIKEVLKKRQEYDFKYATEGFKISIANSALKLPEAEREKALNLLPAEIADDVRKKIQEKERIDYYFFEEDEVNELKKLVHSVTGDLSSDEIKAILDEQILYDLDFKEELERSIFLFEDIVYLSDRAIQRFIREVDTMTLANALCNSDDEVLQKFLRNMSDRAGKMLVEEIQCNIDKLSRDTILRYRRAIIGTINRMADYGEIVMPSNEDQLLV